MNNYLRKTAPKKYDFMFLFTTSIFIIICKQFSLTRTKFDMTLALIGKKAETVKQGSFWRTNFEVFSCLYYPHVI